MSKRNSLALAFPQLGQSPWNAASSLDYSSDYHKMGQLGRREKGKKGKKKERRGIYPYANNAEIDEINSVSELCVFQKEVS